MIALTPETKLAKPAWDARAVDLGRGLDARRNAGWMWLSTQEQVAIARLGKALAANQKALVAGELVIGGTTEAISERKLFGRNFSASELASGVRFTPQGQPPMFASIDVAGIPRSAPAPDNSVLGIERSYYGTDGKPWSPRPLKEGEALIVRVTVTADTTMPDALLTDLLPAGLEIENFNLGDAKQWADVVVENYRVGVTRSLGVDYETLSGFHPRLV
ncbi:hypothetical protein G6F50_013808 [Rhizopus delemar]|uniref:Bacterial alpha-2-macroglobulin MG10 domain-containing protein n=1 Tax=Rhizopus delemar TaxID=936053 RepID=A0A9P7CBK2_9FUNG|nr:hypothetical protein G6F50_013808 [Rhizopus delemar]